MDQLSQQQTRILQQKEYKLKIQEKNCLCQLYLYEQRIKISIMMELSQQKWSGDFTKEELYKVHLIFLMCDTLNKQFEYLCEQILSNQFLIDFNDQKLILKFSEVVRNIENYFTIQLQYENVDPTIQIRNLNQIIIDLKQQVDLLEQNQKKSINEQQEDQNKIQKLEQENVQYKNKVDLLEQEFERLTKIVNEICEKQYKYEEKQIMLKKNFNTSNIIYNKNIDQFRQWINPTSNDIQLELLYQASVDGFQALKFLEKCQNKSPTILCIKTTKNQRFGVYTDSMWQNDSQWKQINISFYFSLDKKQKYKTSSYSTIGKPTLFGFGGGNIIIYSDSNTNQSSYIQNPDYYGMENNQNSNGNYFFTTSEIEVYQVIIK